MTNILTIGFTRKTAAEFFGLLEEAGVARLIDVRLNNVSQLSGFAKRDDLRYFVREICGIDYEHVPLLAPEKEMLDDYKKRKGEWGEYEKRFLGLMEKRRIERELSPDILDGGCLLCSEDEPHYCHRRLAAEYLSNHWGGVNVRHLVIERPVARPKRKATLRARENRIPARAVRRQS